MVVLIRLLSLRFFDPIESGLYDPILTIQVDFLPARESHAPIICAENCSLYQSTVKMVLHKKYVE